MDILNLSLTTTTNTIYISYEYIMYFLLISYYAYKLDIILSDQLGQSLLLSL